MVLSNQTSVVSNPGGPARFAFVPPLCFRVSRPHISANRLTTQGMGFAKKSGSNAKLGRAGCVPSTVQVARGVASFRGIHYGSHQYPGLALKKVRPGLVLPPNRLTTHAMGFAKKDGIECRGSVELALSRGVRRRAARFHYGSQTIRRLALKKVRPAC